MANNRDDNFEGHEESEYHFSDDEVSYEVEAEAPKQSANASGEAKEGMVARLNRSKRMLISLGVFLVLVFVVYKMVAPNSSTPATDISAAPVVANQQPAMPATNTTTQAPAAVAQNTNAPVAMPAAQAVPSVIPIASPTPVNQPASAAPLVAQIPMTQPQTPAQPGTIIPVNSGVQMNPQAADASQQMAQSLAGAQQQALQQLGLASPQSAQQPSAQPLSQPPVQTAQSFTQPGQPPVMQPMQQPVPVVASLPGVLPAEPIAPAYNAGQADASTPTFGNIDAKTAVLSANNEQLMNQLQNQYNQKLNDFSSENKALQDQLQSLTARVSVMEGQLNQLVQVLTRRAQGSNSSMANPAAPPQDVPQLQAASNVKIAYNVQAIIPGRAWLRSENGETLTVAEGDMIRDVGRVTKIDPYDGVVEISTGSKSVSLSYGNGG